MHLRRCLRAGFAALVAGALFAAAPVAHAEDGGDDAEALERQIREQMEKVLALMRENEKALLAAARGAGGKPASVDVTVPPTPEEAAKAPPSAMGEPPPAAMGEPPPAGGDDARRKMEELIRATNERGGSIPGEIESLVKMIPT